MSGSGKGDNRGNRRRPFRRRDRDDKQWQDKGGKRPPGNTKPGEIKLEKNRGGLYERPRWTPPPVPSEPIPMPECPYCGKPITDMAAALSEKSSGAAVHFDCVIARISEGETLEPGDTVTYIGGGRFGIVHTPSGTEPRDFKIKKILEWENKDERAEWRKTVSDHFSTT